MPERPLHSPRLRWNPSILSSDIPLCAAVSGGADSMVMLDLMLRAGYDITVLHCNFGLRGSESDDDEATVRTWCHNHGVAVRVAHFDTRNVCQSTGESIEMAARRLRYDWFCEVAAEVCPTRPAIAVAHHADDKTETLLLNMLRGTGIHGMTGMKARSTYTSTTGRQIEVLRPLLGTSREDIIAYAQAQHIDYRTDTTNADTTMRRNYLRHRVIPLMREVQPAADALLAQAMEHLADAESLIDLAVQDLTRRVCHHPAPTPSATICGVRGQDTLISREGLSHLTPRQRRAALYELTRPYGFGHEVAERLWDARTGALFSAPDHDLCVTAQGWYIGQRTAEFVPRPLHLGDNAVGACTISLEVRDMSADLPSPSRLPNTCAMLDADSVDAGTLVLSPTMTGNRFSPYGFRHGSRLVSDYLTDRHRSRIDKQRALCLCDKGGILWLVGETIDSRAAVTDTTRRVIIIEIKQ